MVADPTALGGTMPAELQAMDTAAHNFAVEQCKKEHPDKAQVERLYEMLTKAMGESQRFRPTETSSVAREPGPTRSRG